MQVSKNPALCGIRDDVSPTDVSPNENSCIYCPLYYLSLAQIIPEYIGQGRNVQGTVLPTRKHCPRDVMSFVSEHIGRGHTDTPFVTSIIQFFRTIAPKLLTSTIYIRICCIDQTRKPVRRYRVNRGDLCKFLLCKQKQDRNSQAKSRLEVWHHIEYMYTYFFKYMHAYLLYDLN